MLRRMRLWDFRSLFGLGLRVSDLGTGFKIQEPLGLSETTRRKWPNAGQTRQIARSGDQDHTRQAKVR